MYKITTKLLAIGLLSLTLISCDSDGVSGSKENGTSASEKGKEEKATYDNSTPENVVNEIIRAAKEKDYSNLSKVCDPENNGDRDSRKLCDLENQDEKTQNEFIEIFSTAEIINIPEIGEDDNKIKIKIQFGEGKTEKLKMAKRDGCWFLVSF